MRRSLATQIVLSAVLTVLLTALALALLNPMLAWINVTPDNAEVYRAAYTYCFIIFAGIGAQLFYNFICAFLRSMGDSLTPLLFLLFSTVLNVGLDLLFIMVFRWGVAGAAIATVAAQLISTVACFIYAFAKYPQLRLHREDMQITRGDIRRHVVQGVPLGLQFSVLAIGIIVMQSVVVQFDMLDGVMVSSSAQMGFGAANRLFNLTATPMNRPEPGSRKPRPHPQGGPAVPGDGVAAGGDGRGHRPAADPGQRLSADLPVRRQDHGGHRAIRQHLPVCGLRHVPVPGLHFPPPWPEASSAPRQILWRFTPCARRTPWPGSPPTSFWPSPSSGTSCGGITGI